MQLILTSTSDYWMSRHCLKTLLEVKLLSTSVGTVSSPLDHDINKGHHSDVKVVQVSIVHFTWQSLSVSVNRTRMTVCNMDSHHLWYWKGKCVLLQTMFQEVLNMLLLNVPLEIWKKNTEHWMLSLCSYTIYHTSNTKGKLQHQEVKVTPTPGNNLLTYILQVFSFSCHRCSS